MAKIGRALLAGDTGDQVDFIAADGMAPADGGDSAAAANAAVTGGVGGQQAVKPQFFKALAGKGHQEFSSGRQQVGQVAARLGQALAQRRVRPCSREPNPSGSACNLPAGPRRAQHSPLHDGCAANARICLMPNQGAYSPVHVEHTRVASYECGCR